MPEIGVNKVILIGRSGADAELRYTSNGKAVANFSLAVNESFKNGDGEQREHVEWVRCVAWGRLAEVCGEFLTKGKQACAEGPFQTRKYDDRNGNERTVCGSTFSLASHDSRSVLAVKGPLRRFAPWTGYCQVEQNLPVLRKDSAGSETENQ